jgi:hypothetical protein
MKTMIEKLLSLLDRYVTAYEKQVESSCGGCACPADEPASEIAGKTVVEGSTAPQAPEPQLHGLADTKAFADMTRDELVSCCEARGLTVPKGTRTKTLVQKLEEFKTPSVPAPSAPLEPDVTFPTPAETPVPDSSAAAPAEAPAEAPATDGLPSLDETRAVLRALMDATDSDTVCQLIKAQAGTEKIKMVPPSQFPAIIAAAQAAIKATGA